MTTRILFLAANPQDTEQLRLNSEIREIEQALKLSNNREQFEFIPKVAVKIKDLQREIRQSEASIVHFSGHGAGDRGLVLEDDAETTKTALTKLGLTQELSEEKDFSSCWIR